LKARHTELDDTAFAVWLEDDAVNGSLR
jgi:hypothetical protein